MEPLDEEGELLQELEELSLENISPDLLQIRRLKSRIKDLELKLRLKDELIANITQALRQVTDALGISTTIQPLEVIIEKGKRKITETEKLHMIQAYKDLVSIDQIAFELSLHPHTVTKTLVELGIHTPRQPVTHELRKRWCDNHIAGESARTIARRHHVSVNTVTKVLRSAGIFRVAFPLKKKVIDE